MITLVRWKRPVEFTDGKKRHTLWFAVSSLGRDEAYRQAWSYFRRIFDDYKLRRMGRLVGKSTPTAEGRRTYTENGEGYYHGDPREHQFTCWSECSVDKPNVRITHWDPARCTFASADEFCGHAEHMGLDKQGNRRFRCLGHAVEPSDDGR